ncbi:hypothetical protein GOZ89_09650 [Agrobacterium vitis]|uniref:hypothetical protein n=1 Tax=Agrobacterium vitis TaxID=373 RepID=UPI0009C15593|nr:hypothetical protein [Agrobacterium vitis]MCE6073658.1 hypothetical protein [Agrobacterium vitis]MCF1468463.1 hypothetical protein [Agrobacterium vitis]MCM2469591.1 hypothetical protein [Agrobacterium vitis]MUO68938.1 hypothetical protein [Agrobacterium vitis]MUO84735.1 hypothetical protein [Agrobacterium vitis]
MTVYPEVEAILSEFEVEIVPKNVMPKPGQTRAVASVDRIRRRHGEAHARFVIMTLVETADNRAALDETALWATSDIILAFKKNHPALMENDLDRFFSFFDQVPVGRLQLWCFGLDGITSKRAALVGLIWERACRLFGNSQPDLQDDRRMST